MIHESSFIGDLRSVVIHLIKHDRPLYKDVMPIVQAYDEHRWQNFDANDKLKYVNQLVSRLDELTDYFEEYPHQWSKQRFGNFVASLQEYVRELKEG